MPRIANILFGGMRPKVSAELLDPAQAQLAINCKLYSGALEPWLAPGNVAGVTLSGAPAIQTIYRYGNTLKSKTQYWFQFTGDVDVVKGAIAGDTEEKTYWTDGTYPKKTKSNLATTGTPYPSNSLRMGIPTPSVAPSVAVTGTATDATATALTSTYVVTYVSSWGEESAPSPASGLATWRPGQNVIIGSLPAVPSGAYSITKIRLYRSNTGSSRTAFQFLMEATIGANGYTQVDNQSDATQLGEVLTTWDYLPPRDNMIGLADCGNGILAGFSGSTVCFSVPFVPYAWPASYELALTAPVVAVCAFGQSLFVGTTLGAEVITVIDPAAASSETIRDAQACVSKRSVIRFMGGVVYAGPDGLAYVGPGGYRNLTEAIITRAEWQAYKPETMMSAVLDGRLYVFYDDGVTKASLIFTFGEDASFVRCDQHATAAYTDPVNDTLFVVQSNTLREWNTSSALSYTWRSKEHRFDQSVSMARAMVKADAYPVTFKLYADGTLIHTQTVTSGTPFPLPAQRAVKVSFQLEGTAKVNSVTVATSAKELANG